MRKHNGQRSSTQDQPTGAPVKTATPEAGSGRLSEHEQEASSLQDSGALASAAQTAQEQVKAGATALGTGMRNLASTLRSSGPHDGLMASAATSLADRLDRSGRHLEEEGLNGLIDDLSGLIRSNPLPAICVGIGIGFLTAHFLRSER